MTSGGYPISTSVRSSLKLNTLSYAPLTSLQRAGSITRCVLSLSMRVVRNIKASTADFCGGLRIAICVEGCVFRLCGLFS